ncbi:MAG: hypothetical protein ACKOZU_08020 [Planctomycetaceae bacterium]
MIRRAWIVAACLLALVGPAASADGPREASRRAKPLALPAVDADTVAAVRLDADVYAASAADLADLRILDAAGQEVPCVIRTATTEKRRGVRRTARAEKPEVRPLADGGLEIVVTIDPQRHPVAPAGFTLATVLENFEHRVSVSWAATGDDWKPLVDDALVYDYEQFMDVRDVNVPLPAEPARPPGGRYRLVIGDVTQLQESQLTELTRTLSGDREVERQERTLVNRQPFRIEALEFWHEEQVVERSSPVLVDRPPAGFRSDRDAAARTTRVTVETRREPLTEFALATDDRNFSRRVTVERPCVRQPANGPRCESRIAAAPVTRIDVAGIRREQLAIPIPESREREYVLVIDDGDSPPIGVTGVTARGPLQEVVFLARPGGDYRIAYGGDLARPRYDTAAIAAALAAGVAPIEATAGAESAAPPPPPDPWHLLADTRVQFAVIAALVVVLALTLFRAARRIDAVADGS